MPHPAPANVTPPPGADPAPRPSLPSRVMRYALGTVVATPANLVLYWQLLVVAGWYEPVANLVAALAIAVPRFVLNKWWVWRRPGHQRLWSEVRSHLLLTGAGLLLSTVVAWLLARLGAGPAGLLAGNVGSFAFTTVARFAVCDQWVFRPGPLTGAETPSRRTTTTPPPPSRGRRPVPVAQPAVAPRRRAQRSRRGRA